MWTPTKDTWNHWKTKAKAGTQSRRRLKSQVRYYKQENEKLRQELEQARAQLSPSKVANHHYPAQMIALAVFIVRQGGSLRVAALAAKFLADLMNWSYKCPSPSTVRNWVLRCGLHVLQSSQDKKGDMVLLIDESIQIGKEKLLLLLGVPVLEDQSRCVPLSIQDVEILGMEVQHSWTSNRIVEFVNRTLRLHPKLSISYVICDRGTSLLAAIKKLQLTWVSDCTHEMMNMVKQIFAKDSALSQLCTELGKLRQRWVLTQWSPLLPPTLRSKDRFCRIFTLVEWARRITPYWERLPKQVQQQLRFFRLNKRLFNRLAQVRDLVDLSARILKTRGISTHTYQQWLQQVAAYRQTQQVWTHAARKFEKSMDAYFNKYLHQGADQQLLCCSDIIESIFGKYKNKGGMKVISADILQIPLYQQTITVPFVQQALGKVTEAKLLEWQQRYVCDNFLQQRKTFEQLLINDRSIT